MSSKNCPETPRQKMIGMMYLFLTAMLAINVSPEILKSFSKVDESLRLSANNFGKQNNLIYQQFDNQNDKNKNKVGEWRDKALMIKKESQTMYSYIQNMKLAMVKKADMDKFTHVDSLHSLDDVETPNNYLLNPLAIQRKEKTRGRKLRDSIEIYKNKLLSQVEDPKLKHIIAESLNTPAPKNDKDAHGKKSLSDGAETWEHDMFGEKPLVATMSMLTKLQNDIRNSEAVAINYLFEQIDAKDIKVNKINAFINPSSTYIMKGGKFSADIGLSAMDTTKTPRVFIGGKEVTLENGTYEFPVSTLGKNVIKGEVKFQNTEGEWESRKLKDVEYEVFEPFSAISATKMNVFYSGVENPINVAVPGVSASDIKLKIDNGTIVKDSRSNSYVVKPERLGSAKIDVIAQIDGKSVKMGASKEFRVKQLPPPSAFVSYPGKTKDAQGHTIADRFAGGRIRKRDLIAATEIGAELQDADFEVSYKMLGFELRTYTSLGNAKIMQTRGSKFDARQLKELRSLSPGKSFFLLNFRVMGPDGVEIKLPAMEVTVY